MQYKKYFISSFSVSGKNNHGISMHEIWCLSRTPGKIFGIILSQEKILSGSKNRPSGNK
jgi:hypothetical protein